MNRREVLKLGTVSTLASMAAVLPEAIAAPHTQTPATALDAPTRASKFSPFEVTLRGPAEGNPFVDVTLMANFSLGHRTLSVDGFYDGEGVYKIRFLPDAEGMWHWTTASNRSALNGQSGQVECGAAAARAHGPVRVHNTSHFAHQDGTP